jgi:hypothetical protein
MKKGDVEKKSYNPFRMWGSWVGGFYFIVGILLIILINKTNLSGVPFLGSVILIMFIAPFLMYIIIGGLLSQRFENIGVLKSVRCEMFGCSPQSFWEKIFMVILLLFILGIIGFLIGWGIHSLIRFYRNK